MKMNNWDIMTTHARLAFAVPQNTPDAQQRNAGFNEAMRKIPGIRSKRGMWLVPKNALDVVLATAERWGVEAVAVAWGVAPVDPPSWQQAEEHLIKEGLRPEYLGDWPMPYQKEGILFGWSRPGSHFWMSTGSGKTFTGIATALSTPGPVLLVTRSAAKIQLAREVERFVATRSFVVRAASKIKKVMTVDGMTWLQFCARKREEEQMGVREEWALLKEKGTELSWSQFCELRREKAESILGTRGEWKKLKEERGVELVQVSQTLSEYLLERKTTGTRPFVVIGWESLVDHIEDLKKLAPKVLILDEMHMGKGRKRWDHVELPPLPDDPEEAKAQLKLDHMEARRKGGFIKENQETPDSLVVRSMLTPVMNRAACAAFLARNADKRIALSVAPNSNVVLRGGVFQSGWQGAIEDAYTLLAQEKSAVKEGTYDLLPAPGVETRGWDETRSCFRWVALRHIIRHPCTDTCTEVRAKGRDLVLTDAHSVYVGEGAGYEYVQGRRKYHGVLAEKVSSDVEVGDIIFADTGSAWEENAEVEAGVDVLALACASARPDRVYVAVALPPDAKELLGLTSTQAGNWVRRGGPHGTYLSLAVWRAHQQVLPRPKGLYTRAKSYGSWLPLEIKFSDYAYLLGLYLGNGWLDSGSNGRIGFSLRPDVVPFFYAAVREIKQGAFHAYTKTEKPRCTEVALTNYFFGSALRARMGKVGARTKFLPVEWVFTWSRAARLELLRGLVDSDGHRSPCDIGAGRVYTTASAALRDGVVLLLRSLGRDAWVHKKAAGTGGTIEGRKIVGGRAWSIGWYDPRVVPTDKRGRGTRFIWPEHVEVKEVRVHAVRPAPAPEWVYDLEREEGHPSFVADGFLVHNTATPIADRVRDLWAQLDTVEPNAWGNKTDWLTHHAAMKPGKYGGMDDTGSSNMPELKQRLDDVTFIVPARVAHEHLLHFKRRQSVYLAPEDQCKPVVGFGKQMAEARKRGPSAILECRIARAASKKRKAVISMVDDHVGSGHKVVIFTGRRKDCDEMGANLRKARMGKVNKVQVWSAHGDMGVEDRQQIVDDYMAHPGPCVLVGTMQAFGQSIDLQDTDAAFMVMLPYTPEMLRQAEGRFLRHGINRAVVIYYVIAEATVDEHIASILIDKLPAVEDIADDQELGAAKAALSGIDENESLDDFAASILADLDE